MPTVARVYPNLIAFFKNNPQESLKQVASDVGCSMPMLSMVKWGKRQPRLELAIVIAQRCHIPLESLIMPEAQHTVSSR